MPMLEKYTRPVRSWLSKDWAQWLVAAIVFFLLSWFFMGNAITNCSTTTTALGSDSTGGLAWSQWADGNDLTWEHTHKSNYPDGEDLTKPQSITSTAFLSIYKVLASLSTPICGLNLIVLLGYMSTALLMFGLVKWLLGRPEIAFFAGFAAAFVPFHTLKAQSHVNYIYGSIFIAIIWAYLWFLSKPGYKRAILPMLATAFGFYFDGYFIFIGAILLGALLSSSFVFDFFRVLFDRKHSRKIFRTALTRLKYLLPALIVFVLLLLPILATYKNSGQAIEQSLAAVRSDIRVETQIYGVRPIEFILPSANNHFVPSKYPAYRATKLHASNYSESTLYMGFTVILLAAIGVLALFWKKTRQSTFKELPYPLLMFTIVLAFLGCFVMSLPAVVTILGHNITTPISEFVKLSANWRVLSRLFLAMDPLVIIAAALGLYMVTKRLPRRFQLAVAALCCVVLFMEYLPSPANSTGDLYKDAPPIYKRIASDKQVKLIAEYPLADFKYTPEIFTFQPIHNKTLLNAAADGSISLGPRDASIAGLNDPQTLGSLKQLRVDLVLTHGFSSNNPGLRTYFYKPNRVADGSINVASSIYSYTIKDSVSARPYTLVIEKGYESLSVDTKQISHRAVTGQATMRVVATNAAAAGQYTASFSVNSLCPAKGQAAQVSITQDGRVLWSGTVDRTPQSISLDTNNHDFYVSTAYCAIDITQLSASTF